MADLFPLPSAKICSDNTTNQNVQSSSINTPCVADSSSTEDTSPSIVLNEQKSINSPSELLVPRRNPLRERHCPSKLQYYIAYAVRYPLSTCMNYLRLSPSYSAFLSAMSNGS